MNLRINTAGLLLLACVFTGCATSRDSTPAGSGTAYNLTPDPASNILDQPSRPTLQAHQNQGTTNHDDASSRVGSRGISPPSGSHIALKPRYERGTEAPDLAAEASHRSIWAAYKTFRYDDVVLLAERLVALDSATVDQKVEAHVLSGAAWYLKGCRDRAIPCFRAVHMMRPGLSLNEEVFPEAIVHLFRLAGTDVAQQ